MPVAYCLLFHTPASHYKAETKYVNMITMDTVNNFKSSKNPLIALDDITLKVGDKLLFEHTNWLLEAGQHWAIIGLNGSGKSTFVNALCHKVPLVHGQIRYFFEKKNEPIPRGRSYLNPREIVVVSPDVHQEFMLRYSGYHQARWQSIEGNEVPTVADLLSGKSIEHRSPYEVTPLTIDEAMYHERREKSLNLLGIRYLLERKIIHLSHGEARKVLIARSLMQSPRLLILDDPFSGLDNSSRESLMKVIEELLTAGTIRILPVTSRIDEIPPSITHILYVSNNQVIAQGPKAQIIESTLQQQTFVPEDGSPGTRPFQFPRLPLDSIETLNLIEMKNISVSYGGIKVLSDITWTIKKGERWAVLGHNGAGKSTLLSLILADNPQSYANEIHLFGKRRGSGESIWDVKQHIGWVSPELQIHYYRSATCREVVCSGFFDSIGLYQDLSPEQAGSVTYWLRLMRINELSEHPFTAVSVGEQRLMLLARALVKNPVLLILDEPCQGLDEGHRKYIIDLLDQLCQQTSVSIIFVTHYFDEIPKAISRVLKLENGRIVANGLRSRILK